LNGDFARHVRDNDGDTVLPACDEMCRFVQEQMWVIDDVERNVLASENEFASKDIERKVAARRAAPWAQYVFGRRVRSFGCQHQTAIDARDGRHNRV